MSTTDFRLVSSRKPINSYQQSTKYGDSGGFTVHSIGDMDGGDIMELLSEFRHSSPAMSG